VGLRLGEALAVGRLTVELPGTGPLTARVAHCTPQGGEWLVGCRFEVPLGDETLRALCPAQAGGEGGGPAGSTAEPGEVATTPPRPPGVLIVDDDAAVRAFLTAALRRRGYRCWEAESGAEAVGLLEQHGGEVELALVDLHMPGLNGVETIQALHRLRPGLPCWIVSGDPGDEAALVAAGASGVLTKPFTVADLDRCLRF
jgi:two-component system cell cycle sensor histidine kinase/response regulator CckA